MKEILDEYALEVPLYQKYSKKILLLIIAKQILGQKNNVMTSIPQRCKKATYDRRNVTFIAAGYLWLVHTDMSMKRNNVTMDNGNE